MSTDNKYFIHLSLKNSDLSSKFSSIIKSLTDFKIFSSNDSQKPDLLIAEIEENEKNNINDILSRLNIYNVDDIFLTANNTDPTLLMQAMRYGVKEFISQPINETMVRQALARFIERKQTTLEKNDLKEGKIISVFGSKGGVGATTIAVNLAVAISTNNTNCSVTLVDMNTLFGEIPLFLELAPKFHWGEITKNIDRLDQAYLDNILTIHKSGLKILPSPAYLNGHIRPTPEAMTRILDMLKQMSDYIIVDGGQSTDDTSLKILKISDTLLLVTILSLPCLTNTNRLIKSFVDLGYVEKENIKVLVNRNVKRSEISLNDAEAAIKTKVFWAIPNDYVSTMTAINNGKTLVDIAPKAPITNSFLGLANSFSSPQNKMPKRKWSLFKRK